MVFHLTPELLQKALTALGVAAGHLRNIDEETRRGIAKLAVQAAMSGDANRYLKERLRWIDERESQPEPAPPPRNVRATSRTVPMEAEFVEDSDQPRPRRPR